MNIEDEIRNAIEGLVNKYLPKSTVREATIISVDWDNRQCSVQLNDGSEIDNVRLKAAIPDEGTIDNGATFKPSVNSNVLVALIEGIESNAFVCCFSDIDGIIYKYNGTEILNIDGTQGTIVFNGGNNGAFINIQSLVDKINRLETIMTAHQHITTTPGNPTTSNDSQTVTGNTQVSDLADDKIKH
jgi:hypothetical protein